jgi:hypothetical protein
VFFLAIWRAEGCWGVAVWVGKETTGAVKVTGSVRISDLWDRLESVPTPAFSRRPPAKAGATTELR